MAKQPRNRVTLPDGSIETRNGKVDYSHAVVVPTRAGVWVVKCWNRRQDLSESEIDNALAASRRLRAEYTTTEWPPALTREDYRVVEVEHPRAGE